MSRKPKAQSPKPKVQSPKLKVQLLKYQIQGKAIEICSEVPEPLQVKLVNFYLIDYQIRYVNGGISRLFIRLL